MKRVTLCLILLLLLSLMACNQNENSLEQPEHTHRWEPANCKRGELCWSCGETRGEALGHHWIDATCEKAKYCDRCGNSEGNPLSHTFDGNGACTVCKQELNNIVTLDGTRSDNGFVVYGGAVLRFPLWSRGVSRAGQFGDSYQIYDQAGTLVTQGTWNTKMPVTYDPVKKRYSTDYHDTEYISLAPGTYRLEYQYYDNWEQLIDYSVNPGGDFYLMPYGEMFSSSNTLIVR